MGLFLLSQSSVNESTDVTPEVVPPKNQDRTSADHSSDGRETVTSNISPPVVAAETPVVSPTSASANRNKTPQQSPSKQQTKDKLESQDGAPFPGIKVRRRESIISPKNILSTNGADSKAANDKKWGSSAPQPVELPPLSVYLSASYFTWK